MNVSQNGINLIKKWEGLRLKAYQDSVGVWTIGFGHTKGVKRGDTCTAWQAEQWLKEEARSHMTVAERLIRVPLNQNQYDALTSFHYNLGKNILSGSNLLNLINSKKWNEAAKKMKEYNRAGGKVLQGLVNRRNDEASLFLKGVTQVQSKRLLYLTLPTYMKGEDVGELQRRLIKLHFYPDKSKANKGKDNVFGKDTDNAFRRWQSVYMPNEVDGKYGERSRKKLESMT